MNRLNSTSASTISFCHSPAAITGDSLSTRKMRLSPTIASCFAILVLAVAGNADAQTINISTASDYFNAIQTVNSNPGNTYTLNFINGFTMSQQVSDFSSNSTITLVGNGKTIDGANAYQPLIIDSGTVVLQTLNTVNGLGPVVVNGGRLLDSTGNLQGPVTNKGVVQFNQTLVGTHTGNITGTGSVEISGGGIETLSGTNTYSGGATVDNNTVLIGTTDSVQGNINNSWLVQFKQATSGTYAGSVSGVGGVEITGGGTVTFTGLNNTYSGQTQVDSGSTLTGTTSTLQGGIINNGAVQFSQNANGTYSGNLTGTGNVRISGTGSVTFSGTNTWSGGTTVDATSTLIGTTGSLQGAFTNNGLVQFNQTTAGTYAGNMTGAGGVQISGGGPVTLTGMNSYTAGTLVDASNTLIGTTDSVQGTIVDDGLVKFNQSVAGTYGGSMSGIGGVRISGIGAVTFSQLNSYTGGTTIDNGSRLIGTTTSIRGNIVDNGALQFNQGTNGTYSGNISGTGSLQFSGGGIVALNGTNTYTGGTTVDNGTELIGTTNSVRGSITNNGVVAFSQNGAGTYAGSMTGTGSVEIAGGPVTFSGANTFSGGTTVDANSGLIGTTTSLQGAITNNGVVQFNQATAGTYGGNMAGTGGVEISGVGPVRFSGLNSYAGGTLVDNGSTLIGTTDSLQGQIVNQGSVQFNQSIIGAYSGNLSGSGKVEIGGSGRVTLSGTNTYTGGTKIDTGSTLIGTTTSLQGDIANTGNLRFSQSAAGTYAGKLSGTGGVEISGTGPITFSGANSYSGGTTVDNGSKLTGSTTSLQGQFFDYGVTRFNQSANGTFAGAIFDHRRDLSSEGIFPRPRACAHANGPR